jgi:hydrogenase nickel incorporation protein HypA/HybF
VHELSIARSVLDIAVRHAGGKRLTAIDLQVGELRQVVPSALSFNFELVAVGTPAEGAELRLEVLPAMGLCRRCSARTGLTAFPLQCGSCQSPEVEIVSGEELVVQAIEIQDAELAD